MKEDFVAHSSTSVLRTPASSFLYLAVQHPGPPRNRGKGHRVRVIDTPPSYSVSVSLSRIELDEVAHTLSLDNTGAMAEQKVERTVLSDSENTPTS